MTNLIVNRRNEELVQLVDNRESLKEALMTEINKHTKVKEELFLSYLSSALEEGDTVNVGTYSYSINRIREENTRLEEIFSINFDQDYWKSSDFNDISISAYSTNRSGSFELQRFITLGKVAAILLVSKDNMLASFNNICEVELNKAKNNYYANENEIGVIEKSLE